MAEREIRIQRSNSPDEPIKHIRVHASGRPRLPLVRRMSAKEPPPRTGQADVVPAEPPLSEDHSPAARARRARRRLKRLFESAKRGAKGRARLRRAHQHEILRSAYRAVRAWREDGIVDEVERELRLEARVGISPRSSLFLLLIRSALPGFDAKRASKAAAALEFADHHSVSSKRLAGFLALHGGIEGAAHGRAKLRARGI